VRIPYWRLVRQSGGKRKETGDRLLLYGLLWLVKAYLLCQFGIKDLKTLPNQTGCWDVWNSRACNFMRDMKAGQQPGISVSYDDGVWMLKYFIPLSELKKTHLQHKAGLSVQPLTSGTWRSVTLSNNGCQISTSSYFTKLLSK
uniref:Uncharacterized protein n=1 Tax=Oncorhynchus tshawytscha TaxID=74940 RepID=A0A8C8EXJ4_ONCTS